MRVASITGVERGSRGPRTHVQGKRRALRCNAAMRLAHGFVLARRQPEIRSFWRFLWAEISSITKSRKAAMRFEWRNSSG